MEHEAGGCGAVPMQLVGRSDHRIPGADLDQLACFGSDPPCSRHHHQHLTFRVSMPMRARSRLEQHAQHGTILRGRGRGDRPKPDSAREVLGWRRVPRNVLRTDDLHSRDTTRSSNSTFTSKLERLRAIVHPCRASGPTLGSFLYLPWRKNRVSINGRAAPSDPGRIINAVTACRTIPTCCQSGLGT